MANYRHRQFITFKHQQMLAPGISTFNATITRMNFIAIGSCKDGRRVYIRSAR